MAFWNAVIASSNRFMSLKNETEVVVGRRILGIEQYGLAMLGHRLVQSTLIPK